MSQDDIINLLNTIANNSRCLRRKVGAILMKDEATISVGFNRVPYGQTDCQTCARENFNSGERLDLCRAIHAEEDAIMMCVRSGISTQDSALYVTNMPCNHCAKLIVEAGIDTVYYINGYECEHTKDLLSSANVKLVKLDI